MNECKPLMSGFFAVLFALQMCDKVNLYGRALHRYTMSKQSGRGRCPGTPVHYEQTDRERVCAGTPVDYEPTVRTRGLCGCTGTL